MPYSLPANFNILTIYTDEYKDFLSLLYKSFPGLESRHYESFAYINKIELLLEYVKIGKHATWVDADSEIHASPENFMAPANSIYVALGYDTYFISCGPGERTIRILEEWIELFHTYSLFDADALRPIRQYVTPVDTTAFMCHHKRNIMYNAVNSPKRMSLRQVSDAIASSRMDACKGCSNYQSAVDKCGTCGCSSTMALATKSAFRSCPLNKWPQPLPNVQTP